MGLAQSIYSGFEIVAEGDPFKIESSQAGEERLRILMVKEDYFKTPGIEVFQYTVHGPVKVDLLTE